MLGALLGTSNVTTYVESASGVSVGGRTGLTSVTVSLFFILVYYLLTNSIGMHSGEVTAPVLILQAYLWLLV